MRLSLNKRTMSIYGFAIYLLGMHFGNTPSLMAFIVFAVLSFPQIKKMKLGMMAGSCLLLFLFSVISLVWVDRAYTNMGTVRILLVNLFQIFYLAVFISCYIRDKEDIIQMIKLIALTEAVYALYIILMTPLSYWGTSRFGRNIDTSKNNISMQYAFAAVFLFFMLKNRLLGTKPYLWLMLLFSAIALLSSSRKGLLILVLGVLMYYILSERNYKLLRNIGISIVAVVAVVLLLRRYNVFQDLEQRMINMLNNYSPFRSAEEGTDVSLTERAFYRREAIALFAQHPILGAGIHGFTTYMRKINYSHVAYSHNNFTEMLADFGIIGFIIYYFPRFAVLVRLFKARKKSQWALFGALVMLISLLNEYGFVSFYTSYMQIYYILLFVISQKIVLLKDEPVPLRTSVKRKGVLA